MRADRLDIMIRECASSTAAVRALSPFASLSRFLYARCRVSELVSDLIPNTCGT